MASSYNPESIYIRAIVSGVRMRNLATTRAVTDRKRMPI
jgi:hypothetical protein